MNLHQIVAGYVGAVNPQMEVAVQISTGNVKNADYTITPTFAPPVVLLAQVQPITWRDIQQLDALNLQGTRKVAYLSGNLQGLVRPLNDGGDLVTFPDGSIWLVALVLEDFSPTSGWCKVALTLQNQQLKGSLPS